MGRLIIVVKEAVIEHDGKERALLSLVQLAPLLTFRALSTFLIKYIDELTALLLMLLFPGLVLASLAVLAIRANIHEGFHERLDRGFMRLVLHGVFIDKSHDAFLPDWVRHHVLAQVQELVKYREDLLVQRVGDVVDYAAQLVREEVLKIWVVGLTELAFFDIQEYDVQEFEHRLRGTILSEVF